MFDLCKFFGVSKNEVFQLKDIITNELSENDYRINDNTLQRSDRNMNKWSYCPFALNAITNYDVIKLKQFTNEELTILKSIDTKYKWVARDEDNSIYAFEDKPTKSVEDWNDVYVTKLIKEMPFENIFKSIKWKDNEPVYIDAYVVRKQN